MKIFILPSLLAADIGHLADEIKRAEDAGADELHLDIMDGAFVPNISFGPNIVELAKKHTGLLLNVHLMLARPDLYVAKFIDAGADTVQIHVESSCDPAKVIEDIRARGANPAIVLNPLTPYVSALPYINSVNECLYMSVFPGYGGQKFKTETLSSVKSLREELNKRGLDDFRIMVDGGIDRNTIKSCYQAGANAFVAGTALFSKQDMKSEIKLFREIINAF